MKPHSHSQPLPADRFLEEDIAQVLISQDELRQRIAVIGGEISKDYAGKNPLMIGVLKGVLFFMADLLRDISIPVEVDFLAVSSYSDKDRTQGMVRLVKDLDMPIYDRHIIFVEDVIDTGLTLNYLLNTLRMRNPASLEVCVLFNKQKKRLIEIPIKYKGFDLIDRFVVGYGLDFREKYRNLPYVGLLYAQVYQNNLGLKKNTE
jgi:hypoxanthine phosphoribosyltransferase